MRKKWAYFAGGMVMAPVVALAIMLVWPMSGSEPFEAVVFRPVPGPAEARPKTTYEARDGQALPLRVYSADGAKRALILLHGIAVNGDYFHEMASYLAQRGTARVYVPDLRAHGHGSEPVADVDYIGQLEDDVADLVAHVRRDMPEARVFIGGHSAGGGLTLRIAASSMDGVDGYLLLAPALDRDAPTHRERAGGLVDVRLPRLVTLSVLDRVGIRALHGLEVLRVNWPERYHGDHLTLRYTLRYTRSYLPSDHAAAFSAVEAPLLLVAGDADAIFRGDRYAGVVEAYAPHGDVVTTPGLGHFEGLLSNPEMFEVYADWLESHDADDPVPVMLDQGSSTPRHG
jgi:non-heme chloroperoxidase